ncbi:MAG TPA: metal ABC transporter permease [Amaricoccus sp.]|uniref:metal ABC transporter permease n=1 Tax=Amaricoccus sp. TaxID=1872485 RepID=UPI002B5AADBA|nr:metal ABC transporter permease [Amaricoccus sp.]HMQ92547.1 metal ABC transporter permease [Amaricoccus sp.]HMR52106.1 metal ABC transporter permease [Amaricoccus sp.]HMR60131.1 metal ABC transporter permease [Amaricoccus sp.]HMT98908.1 metal ABC transporter permease [Amaricoccus sp.]
MSPLDDFLLRAVLAGTGVALVAGPLGCFVVWRRMAYFGDATAHAALIGVTLALATELPVVAGVALAALAMALTVSLATGRTYAMDTMLGVAAHGALAAGLVALSLLPGVRVDLMGYLFGDILAVSRSDLLVIWAGGALILALLVWRWRGLLLATLSADLAAAAGIAAARERLVLTVALALLVAVALKVVGALLITAMLIVPAAAARAFAPTPEAMAVVAAGIGAVASAGGLAASFRLDSPAGPSIVVAAVVLLLLANGIAAVARRGGGRGAGRG